MAWPSPNEIGLPTPIMTPNDLQSLFQEQLSLNNDSNYQLDGLNSSSHRNQLAHHQNQQQQQVQPNDACQSPVSVQASIPIQPQQSHTSNVIHYAAAQGFVDMLKKMLSTNPNEIEFVDSNGNTPLLLASINGHYEVIELLIDSGANINAVNDFDNSAIHETAWRGYSRSLELLCRTKAKLYLKNKQGHTALHLAAQKGHNQCTRILLRTGCKPNIKNNFGDTPLHSASRYGHVGVVRILISAFANVNELNRNDDTALHIASAMGRKKLAKILLESGCNPTVVNKQGETPMNIALRKEFFDIQEMIVSPPPLKPIHLKQQELYIRPFQGSFKDIYCALPKNSNKIDAEHEHYHRTRSHERRQRSHIRHRVPRRSSRGCKSDYSIGVESENALRRKSPYHDDSDSDEAAEQYDEDDADDDDYDDDHDVEDDENSRIDCVANQQSKVNNHYPKPKLETLPSEPLQVGEQYFVDPSGRIHKAIKPGLNQIPLATILGEPVLGRRHMRQQQQRPKS